MVWNGRMSRGAGKDSTAHKSPYRKKWLAVVLMDDIVRQPN
jgi:hypothetical protein